MYNEELYDRTLQVLLNAYESGTLLPAQRCCCEIGNLVAAANGLTIHVTPNGIPYLKKNGVYKNQFDLAWTALFATASYGPLELMRLAVSNGKMVRKMFKGGKLWVQVRYADNTDLSKGIHAEGMKEIDSTGYPLQVAMDMEWAFETGCLGESDEASMYKGLMAALDVLDKYHQVGQEATKKAVERFSTSRKKEYDTVQ